MGIKIDPQKCATCGNCIPVCPFALLESADDQITVKEGCNSCGACVDACEYAAITMESVETAAVSDDHHGVWVFAEQRHSKLKGVTYELLSKGRELADTLKTELCAVCLGHDIQDIAQLAAHGADKVYLVDSPELADNPED